MKLKDLDKLGEFTNRIILYLETHPLALDDTIYLENFIEETLIAIYPELTDA